MGGGRGVADRGSAEFLLIESTEIIKKSIKIKKRRSCADNTKIMATDVMKRLNSLLIMNTNKTI